MKHIIMVLFCCFPLLLQAADLPDVVNANDANNQHMCIDRATNDCINTVCENSPDINCTSNCQKTAQDKCKEMSEE